MDKDTAGERVLDELCDAERDRGGELVSDTTTVGELERTFVILWRLEGVPEADSVVTPTLSETEDVTETDDVVKPTLSVPVADTVKLTNEERDGVLETAGELVPA